MMPQEYVLRKTRSVCPACLKDVDASVMVRDGVVLLSKQCPEHGVTDVVLSRRPEFYVPLEQMYFRVMDEKKPISEYELWLTMTCDTECVICHLGQAKYDAGMREPSIDDIESFIKANPAPAYVLSGGEPTCRRDILEIIKVFKKHGKVVTMHTNGLSLHDRDFAARLKATGIDRLNLQFDGFERHSYKELRGTDILDMKLKQLEYLQQLDIPIDLNMTVARDINHLDVGGIIDYAAKHPFVKGVNFFTICFLGGVRTWPMSRYIMPDEVVDCVERSTGNKITRRSVFLFQKLHLAMKSWQGARFCLYSQVFALVRRGGGYEPIERYFDLERAEPWIDLYQHLYPKHKILAKVLLALTLPFALLRWSTFGLLTSMIGTGLSYFFHGAEHLKSNVFMFVSFSTACDRYKIDYGLMNNCQDGIVHEDKVTGKFSYQGCDGMHCIEMEKQRYGARSS